MSALTLAVAAIAGGLVILGLATWAPRHLARQEAAWRAEWAEHAQAAVPDSALQTVGPPGSRRSLALLSLALGVLIAASCHATSGWSARTGATFVFACTLSALALIDARTRLLPDVIVFPALWLGILLQTVPGLETIGLKASVWGTAAGYLMLWLPAVLFEKLRGTEAMGHGDFKLMALIGAWLGPASLVLTLLAASVAAVIFHLVRGLGRHAEFPFGPWLAGAALVLLLA